MENFLVTLDSRKALLYNADVHFVSVYEDEEIYSVLSALATFNSDSGPRLDLL